MRKDFQTVSLGFSVNKPVNQPGGYRAEKNLRAVAAKLAALLLFASSRSFTLQPMSRA